MNVSPPRVAGTDLGAHPALLGRRANELTKSTFGGLVTLGIAMAIALNVPHPNLGRVLVILAGALAVFTLLASPNYALTLTIVVLYLGLLDGPVKLLTASQAASAVRNVLIVAVTFGAIVRVSVIKDRIQLPPLSGWVLGFVAVVLVQAANPHTHGLLKVLGGYRQELEWVPFFFFAYALIRSKRRFRQMFLLFGVLALTNGAVGLYQAQLSPAQLGSWGPGYQARIEGTSGSSKRTFVYEGESKPRAPALGPDSGFGGGMGVLALPGLLAMLTVGRLRRRWVAMVLCAGALTGIASSGSRSSLIIGIVALLSYAGMSVVAGLKPNRLLVGVIVGLALAVGVVSLVKSTGGKGVLHRQETVSAVVNNEAGGAQKKRNLAQVPRDFVAEPFGSGLGTGGSAGGFGGKQKVEIEGRGATREGALNLLVLETGAPGMLLWVALTINVVFLGITRLRRIVDPELRTYLVALFAGYLAFTADGFAGPTLAGAPAGTFLWFVPGVVAWWLVGPGFRQATMRSGSR